MAPRKKKLKTADARGEEGLRIKCPDGYYWETTFSKSDNSQLNGRPTALRRTEKYEIEQPSKSRAIEKEE